MQGIGLPVTAFDGASLADWLHDAGHAWPSDDSGGEDHYIALYRTSPPFRADVAAWLGVAEGEQTNRMQGMVEMLRPCIDRMVERLPDGATLRVWTCGVGRPADASLLTLLIHERLAANGRGLMLRVMGSGLGFTDSPYEPLLDGALLSLLPAACRRMVVRTWTGGYDLAPDLRRVLRLGAHDVISDPPLNDIDLLVWRGQFSRLTPKARRRVLSRLGGSVRPAGLLFVGCQTSPVSPASMQLHLSSRPPQYLFEMPAEIASAGSLAPLPDREEVNTTPPNTGGHGHEGLLAANEQLRAVNEELAAVNEEFHRKLTELSSVSDDLSNLIRSTDIATIFVDDKLAIRLFTPGAERFYGLRAADVGRRLSAFKPRFSGPSVEAATSQALASGQSVESQVALEHGKGNFLRRISPYRDGFGRIVGLTISFVDVTALVTLNRELAASAQRLSAIYNLSPSALWVLDWSGVIDRLESLRAAGVTELARYLAADVAEQQSLVDSVSVTDLNGRAIDMLGVTTREEAMGQLQRAFRGESLREPLLCAIVEYFSEGETYRCDCSLAIKGASTDHLLLSWSFPDRLDLSRVVFVSALDFRDRKKAENALRASELRQRKLINAIDDCGFGLRVVDDRSTVRYRNRRSHRILGERVDRSLGAFVNQGDALDSRLAIANLPPADETLRLSVDTIDGRTLEVVAMRYQDVDGSLCRLEMIRDVSAERRMIEEQRIAATTFETQQPMLVVDTSGRIVKVNRAFSGLSGFALPTLDKRAVTELVAAAPAASPLTPEGFQLPSAPWNGELQCRRAVGEPFPAWCMISPVTNEQGRITHSVLAFTDISERKESEAAMMRLALYDPLTGLPNRRFFLARLEGTVADARARGEYVALLYADLDGFKPVNDALGHDSGDELLREVSRRLAATVRSGDIIARLGGDEFVVVLNRLGTTEADAREGARIVARKIGQALQLPYRLADNECQAGASIGISLVGPDGGSASQVLKQADLALYEAKAAGGHAIRFFELALQRAHDRRTDLDAALRRAVEARRFVLLLQPQFHRSGRMIGAEALLRWSGEHGALIPPSEFIPHAEDSGLILPIGDWVLETACHQLRHWSEHAASGEMQLSVNISARQFKQPGFVARVTELLQDTGADPRRLRFEITESVLLEDMSATIEKMRALRALGVAFSIDDFGTGYSSLSYLRELPVDELKIDRKFVRDFVADTGSQAIVHAIIAMAKALNLEVLAEGVETEAEWRALAAAGCDSYQGFLFGRPVAGTQALLTDIPPTANAAAWRKAA